MSGDVRMKKLAFVIGLLLILVSVAPVAAGNGGPSGQHFTLNIIGSKTKTMPANLGGNTIFVLYGKTGNAVTTKIMLQEGPFAVIDKNGSDGTATFQLPYPWTDIDSDGIADSDEVGCYEIWSRALSPTGSADMYTCLKDTDNDYGFGLNYEYCDIENHITLTRTGKGVGKFVDVTKALTTINVPTIGVVPIFADIQDAYWWEYVNSNLKHAQLRFYPVPGTECAVNTR